MGNFPTPQPTPQPTTSLMTHPSQCSVVDDGPLCPCFVIEQCPGIDWTTYCNDCYNSQKCCTCGYSSPYASAPYTNVICWNWDCGVASASSSTSSSPTGRRRRRRRRRRRN